jgi:hypothetical protein
VHWYCQTEDKGYKHPAQIPKGAEWSCAEAGADNTVVKADYVTVTCSACTAATAVNTPSQTPTPAPSVAAAGLCYVGQYSYSTITVSGLPLEPLNMCYYFSEVDSDGLPVFVCACGTHRVFHSNSSVLLHSEQTGAPVSVWAVTWVADGLACQVGVM